MKAEGGISGRDGTCSISLHLGAKSTNICLDLSRYNWDAADDAADNG
jgi:hypothetical protein